VIAAGVVAGLGGVLALATTAGAAPTIGHARQAPHAAHVRKIPTLSPTLVSFPTTNGDVLATTVMATPTGRDVAVSGDFTAVRTTDGVQHPAANLAVFNELTGALVYAAASVSSNGYVRSLTYRNGILYAGGDFTSYDGLTRHRLVAINTTTWAVTNWNPGTSDSVHVVRAGMSAVFIAGAFGKVESVSLQTGKVFWSDRVTGGGVRALLVRPAKRRLYVAGFFNTVGSFANHGLVELNSKTGAPITAFAPTFRKNTGVGRAGSYNGEDPMTLALDKSDSPYRLLMGSGGNANYVRMLNLTTGAFYWSHLTPGDVQSVAMVGGSAIVGYHRNAPNGGTFHWPYYIAQLTAAKGKLQSWHAALSGKPAKVTDGLNNGIRGLAFDRKEGRLFVVGAFTTYGAHCHPDLTVTCTGGTVHDYVAEYAVSF
jgi:hypothetical protein